MASDWPTDTTLAMLAQRIVIATEQNLAPIPVAMSYEAGEDGTMQWTVDIMVRTNAYEIDTTASHPSLPTALKNAYLRFCRSHTFYLRTGLLPD